MKSMPQTEQVIIQQPLIEQFKARPVRAFTKDERETTKILIGGLTWRHERLTQAALKSLGYQIEIVGTPQVSAYHVGKEFGNNGQCNPTYFTVGRLVEYLQELEQQGLSRQQICDEYVFVTAGACGPCRFGMYEAEYNLALENAGFSNFRVLTFQQNQGINHENPTAGLNLNLSFYIAVLVSLSLGDMISEMSYRIRPYEVNKGSTDDFIATAINILANAFNKTGPLLQQSQSVFHIWRHYLQAPEFVSAFQKIRQTAEVIEVDYFRNRPVVKITGEFWAQITEGDGNFRMFEFLEENDAQLMVEPIGNWIMYMLHQVKQANTDKRGLVPDAKPGMHKLWSKTKSVFSYSLNHLRLSLAEYLFRRYWESVRTQLGDHLIHRLTDQYELQQLAHPHLNSRAKGGEGHLEVGKNIYYTKHKKAHMVLSLKPFGCMPSTQSDGVQSILSKFYPEMIYLPLSTACEGKANAHSRVMMALDEARKKSDNEFETVLANCEFSLAEMKDYVAKHESLKTLKYRMSRINKTTGLSANFIQNINQLMLQDA